MPAPQEVQNLIARFEDHLEVYKSGDYNEAQLRDDFLNPLFDALGWDVDNAAGYAQAYRDVIKEDSLRIAGGIKAPDFSFRIGGRANFSLKRFSLKRKDRAFLSRKPFSLHTFRSLNDTWADRSQNDTWADTTTAHGIGALPGPLHFNAVVESFEHNFRLGTQSSASAFCKTQPQLMGNLMAKPTWTCGAAF